MRPLGLDRRTRAARVTTTAAVAIGAGLVLAACTGATGGSGSTTSSPAPSTSTATVTATASNPPSTPAGGATSGSSSTSTGKGGGGNGGGGGTLANCRESQLRASIDPRPVTGASRTDKAVIVDFTNTSNSTCRIVGYPGAALVDDSGKQVQQARRTIRGQVLGLPRGRNTPPSVTLRPGAVSSAGLEGVSQVQQGAAQAGCYASGGRLATFPRILVTPPNTSTPVPFTVSWPICFSFDVHPTNIEKNPPN